MIDALWSTLLELSPWLLLGAAIAGALHVVLPEGTVRRHLQGRWGVPKAVALGVPLPLCSCGVIPAGIGLKKDGASDGASVAFLVSTPQTGVDSILVSAAFLGWPFALFKVGAAAITGLSAGWLVDAVQGPTGQQVTLAPTTSSEDASPWSRGFAHAEDLVRSIWRWLVFGIVVSAALQVWLPADALAGTLVGSGVVAGLLVLLLSLPLYVCATASVPIAAGLIHAGMPTGAALVFLMAGPASNVATMGAVREAFGTRVLAMYLSVTAVGSLALGMLFDALVPVTVGAAHGGHEVGIVATLSAVLLLTLFVRYAVEDLRDWARPAADDTLPSLELSVEGMTCQGCARKLDRHVREVHGVDDLTIEVETGQLAVRGHPDLDQVREAVRKAGFTPG